MHFISHVNWCWAVQVAHSIVIGRKCRYIKQNCEHTCIWHVQVAFVEGVLQGLLGGRPNAYGGVTKWPNASKYVRCPRATLRGKYLTCRRIITTYVHLREGEFQYNNVLHSENTWHWQAQSWACTTGRWQGFRTVIAIGVRRAQVQG
jgi:hypothetical protein